MKIVGVCILLFILSFGLSSSVYADNSVNNGNNSNVKNSTSIKAITSDDNLNSSDNSDDSNDYLDDNSSFGDYYSDDSGDYWDDGSDDFNDYSDDNSSFDDYYSNYYEWEWKGYIYYIDLDQFNLTDDELTELFTNRDALMEDTNNLEALIHEKWLSRSNDTLLAIDALYGSMNNITNNTEFNDLLLSLKDINITGVNVTFDELKSLLESIKLQYPDENFSEVDSLMSDLGILLNGDLEVYENSHSELDGKLAELSDLLDSYPFLKDYTKYNYINLHNYYKWEWKGYIYYIDLDQFNLTDDELMALFTKRDALMEEIDNLEALIKEMELSRSNDTLLAIDAIYDSMNSIVNNTEFNELLLSLKDIDINEINSTFNELKSLLESIKAEYPDEDFLEVDSLMSDLEILLNRELEKYENLTSELDEKLAELFELFSKYPFLMDHTKYSHGLVDFVANTGYVGGYMKNSTGGSLGIGNNSADDSKSFNKVSAGMKNTGIPIIAMLLVLLSTFGIFVGKKQK